MAECAATLKKEVLPSVRIRTVMMRKPALFKEPSVRSRTYPSNMIVIYWSLKLTISFVYFVNSSPLPTLIQQLGVAPHQLRRNLVPVVSINYETSSI